MSRKRHKAEEIVAKLRQVDVLLAQGQTVADAIRSIGVTEVTYGTSFWMGSWSTACARRRSSSRAGVGTTTRFARTPLWATGRLRRRCSCRGLPRARLRNACQLRRPRSR